MNSRPFKAIPLLAMTLVFMTVGSFGLMGATALGSTTVWPQSDQDRFYSQLQAGIAQTEAHLQQLVLEMANDHNKITDHNQIIVDAEKATLEVKATLFSNFYNTPSVQNPEVRAYLLRIFQKDIITIDDLTGLQRLVGNVKAAAAAQAAQQAAAAQAAQNAVTTPSAPSNTQSTNSISTQTTTVPTQ